MLERLFSSPTPDQVMALAGIFQACQLVDSHARLGSGNPRELETAIHSLLQQNPASTEAVYGGLANLETGLDTLAKVLAKPRDPATAQLLRYVLGVLHIARKIHRNGAMLNAIGEGIARAGKQAETFGASHANVIANIADLYQNTISTLSFRIQVSGVASNLQQPSIAARIRCLLFAAVRSAILWQQLHGSRLQLMIRREAILALTRDLHREARRLGT